jgi:hypothetical protein
MLKRLLKVLAFLAILFFVALVGINVLLDPITHELFLYAIENSRTPNLTLSDLSFRNARISSYNAITWDDFSLTATMAPDNNLKKTIIARMNAREITVEVESLFEGLFNVYVNGLSISAENPNQEISAGGPDAPEALQDGTLIVSLQINVKNYGQAESQMRKYAAEMKKFFEEGQTTLPIKFSAEHIITIKGDSYTVSLWVEQKGNVYRLVAKRDDLQFVSENILPKKQTSTPADIQIIVNNPIRAPQLLRIRSKASNTAASAYAQDPKVPEDAYRHVLWSFLLTREYGAAFAKEVTDAHERTNDSEEKNGSSFDASHRQDLNNGEVGRNYAAQSYTESDILNLVMTDPKVIR